MTNETPTRSPAERRQDIADYSSPLIYNQWYVIGLAESFTEELREITVLEHSLVIYRTAAGEPVALQNRCAHRSFPLAKSWKEGDDIRCRYHGAKYSSDGKMIDVPCQGRCPRVNIRKYPLRETGPLVWVWMGDPALAETSEFPKVPFVEPGWETAVGEMFIESNYLIMMENLMDLTHVPFLHKETFKVPESYAAAPIDVVTNGKTMSYGRTDLGDTYHRSLFFSESASEGFAGKPYKSASISDFHSPAWMDGGARIWLEDDVELEGMPKQKDIAFRVAHFLTPETRSSTHYWWLYARNYDLEDKDFTTASVDRVKSGFTEDLFACREIQNLLDNDKRDFKEIHFAGDKPSIAMRRIVQQLIDEETEEE